MSEQTLIEGKTFLITGAASGLGAVYAEAFLKEGAKNVSILDVAVDLGKATADRLNNIYPGKAIFIKCDVTSEEDVTAAFDKVLNECGHVDVIINNAGILNDSPEMWRKACDVNWKGVVAFSVKGLKHMGKDEGGAGGTIINISSAGALHRWRYLPMYSALKMAVLHFSQCLAMEPSYEQTNVRILTLCLGATDTSMVADLDKKAYNEKFDKELVEQFGASVRMPQKTESAVAACVKIFREGNNGSVWIATHNKAAENITPVIDSVYEQLKNTRVN